MRISVPNQVTLARLVLGLGFLVLLALYSTPQDAERHWILPLAFWIFLLAALGDILDGWLARTLGQVTTFGRVIDPVVDKVVICGAFVFFCSTNFYDPARGANVTGVAPWMTVVVLFRELLVSAIRAFSESQGDDFAAIWVGKLKMFIQSVTVCIVLAVLAWYPDRLAWLRETAVWATVVVTSFSILSYVRRAERSLFSASALGGESHTSTPNR